MWVKERPPVPWRGGSTAADVGLAAKAPPALPQQHGGCPPSSASTASVVNRLSLPEYRARLVDIYKVHKQENVEKVDYLLQKYRGQEEYLYQSVCQKYHINPEVGIEAGSVLPQATSPESQQVMEWDPATGQMVATTMDLDSGVGVGRRPSNDAVKQSSAVSFAAAAAAQAAAAMREREGEDPEEDDEYDPFSTGPDQASKLSKVPKDPMEAMIQIDFLLLGERSYFFEPDSGSVVVPDKAALTVVQEFAPPTPIVDPPWRRKSSDQLSNTPVAVPPPATTTPANAAEVQEKSSDQLSNTPVTAPPAATATPPNEAEVQDREREREHAVGSEDLAAPAEEMDTSNNDAAANSEVMEVADDEDDFDDLGDMPEASSDPYLLAVDVDDV